MVVSYFWRTKKKQKNAKKHLQNIYASASYRKAVGQDYRIGTTPVLTSVLLIQWIQVLFRLVLGDTDDTSIYRDTKISRYWYRACLDTFWYRDTKSIAIFFDTFCRYCTRQNPLIRYFGNFITLTVSVTHACMYISAFTFCICTNNIAYKI